AVPPWLAIVDLVPRGERLEVRLSSNQLRGRADNVGWYQSVAVAAPTLVLRADGERVEVPFSDGIVGGVGAVTPLTVALAAPAGAWEVALRVQPRDPGAPWSEARGPTLEVVLAEGWTRAP